MDRELHRMDPNRAIDETIELDRAIGVARQWAARQGNNTLILVTADHETAGLALTGVNEGGRPSGRSFPTYSDANGDRFPDSLEPDLAMTFDFPAGFNPSRDARNYDLPRNLRDLNPSTTRATSAGPAAGHTAVDVPISASGPGANLFGGVMDNTDIFFRMLRTLARN